MDSPQRVGKEESDESDTIKKVSSVFDHFANKM